MGTVRGLSDEFIEEVRSRNDIVDVIGEQVALRKTGKNFVGLCPFHHEKTPSFSVAPDKQMFYCFGCHAGGNVFHFLMKRDKLTFPEAVTKLAERVGLPLPEPELSPEEAQRRQEREAYLNALELAAEFYSLALLKSRQGAAAREYLGKRGLTAETVDHFHLGYAPDAWDLLFKALSRRGLSPKVMEGAGLILRRNDGDSYYDRLRNRVVFPIQDARGRIIAFGGRVLDDSLPKYLNSSDTAVFAKGRNLYALNFARPSIREHGLAVLVEGYMDAIACHQAGVTNVVATLGTALTREQGAILSRLAPETVIAYDADTAGQSATMRGLEILGEAGCKVKVAVIEEGKDPDELIRRHGPEAFRGAVAKALPLVDYRFSLAMKAGNPATVEGKVGIAATMAPVLAGLDNAVEREAYIQDFATKLGLSVEALRTEVRKAARARQAGGTGTGATARPTGETAGSQYIPGSTRNNNGHDLAKAGKARPSARLLAERGLLRVVLDHPELTPQVAGVLGPEDFVGEAERALAEVVLGGSGQAGEATEGEAPTTPTAPDATQLMAHFQTTEHAEAVAELLMSEPPPGEPDKLVQGYLKRIREESVKSKAERVRAEMERLEREGRPIPEAMLREYLELQQLRSAAGTATPPAQRPDFRKGKPDEEPGA
ncbi:MAG: DNA primase [Bacillota bacterium]